MASTNTLATMNQFFKIRYADYYQDRVPNFALLQADIKFNTAKRLGRQFVQPICLGMEHGVVYAASGAGAFSLTSVPSVAASIEDAVIMGSQVVLKSRIDYEAAQAAVGKGEAAFANSTSTMVKNMWKSVRKRIELDLLYGQSGVGIVSAVATSGATATITLDSVRWADAIWAGMEGARVQFLTGTTTHSTVTNSDVKGVDIANNAILMATTTVANVAANDVVFFQTQKTTGGHNSCKGLFSLLNSPTNVFGITCASFSLWNPVTYARTTPATTTMFASIQKALVNGIGKGLDGDVVCYLNPASWELMSTNETTYRRYDSSYTGKKYETGVEELRFHSQTGLITIKPHPFVWKDYAFIVDPTMWKRIGVTDVTFSRAPMGSVDRSNDFFIELENAAGYELRCYSHQAPFTDALGRSILMSAMSS